MDSILLKFVNEKIEEINNCTSISQLKKLFDKFDNELNRDKIIPCTQKTLITIKVYTAFKMRLNKLENKELMRFNVYSALDELLSEE